jgi:hypothetical protein
MYGDGDSGPALVADGALATWRQLRPRRPANAAAPLLGWIGFDVLDAARAMLRRNAGPSLSAEATKIEKRFQAARRQMEKEIAATAAGDDSKEQLEHFLRARRRLERAQQSMLAVDRERAETLDREVSALVARYLHARDEEAPRARRAHREAQLAALDEKDRAHEKTHGWMRQGTAPRSRFVYRSVGASGEPYPPWVRELKGQSGVYLIRDAKTRELLYVGMSSTGNLYETLTRHLQQWRRWTKRGFWPGQFARSEHDPGLTYPRDRVEVAVRVMPENEALDEEIRLIRTLKPRDNLIGQQPEPEAELEPIPF